MHVLTADVFRSFPPRPDKRRYRKASYGVATVTDVYESIGNESYEKLSATHVFGDWLTRTRDQLSMPCAQNHKITKNQNI